MTLTARQRAPQDCPLRGVVETCPDILKLALRLAALISLMHAMTARQDLGKDSVDGSNMLTSLLQIPFTSPSVFFHRTRFDAWLHDRNRNSLRIRPMFDSELYDCLLQPRLSAMQPPISPHLAMPDLLSPRLPAFWTRNDGENSLGHEWSWKQIHLWVVEWSRMIWNALKSLSLNNSQTRSMESSHSTNCRIKLGPVRSRTTAHCS